MSRTGARGMRARRNRKLPELNESRVQRHVLGRPFEAGDSSAGIEYRTSPDDERIGLLLGTFLIPVLINESRYRPIA